MAMLMQVILIENDDACRFKKISKVLGDDEKAVSFTLGLSLAVLGIHKPDVSQFLEPQNRNQRREPFSRG